MAERNANQMSRYGAVSRMVPFTTGKVFFVTAGSEPAISDLLSEFPLDTDGVQRVYTTFAAAAALTVANRYDIVMVSDPSFVTATNLALVAATGRIVVFGDDASVGSEFSIQKTLVSSALTTSAQDLSLVSTGRLLVENVVVETNGTGLAGATNFRILSNNVNGLSAILEETVANLGANKTVDIFSASIVKQRTILESGKKLQYLGTVGAGTGAGTVTVTVTLRRLDAGAQILNA